MVIECSMVTQVGMAPLVLMSLSVVIGTRTLGGCVGIEVGLSSAWEQVKHYTCTTDSGHPVGPNELAELASSEEWSPSGTQ